MRDVPAAELEGPLVRGRRARRPGRVPPVVRPACDRLRSPAARTTDRPAPRLAMTPNSASGRAMRGRRRSGPMAPSTSELSRRWSFAATTAARRGAVPARLTSCQRAPRGTSHRRRTSHMCARSTFRRMTREACWLASRSAACSCRTIAAIRGRGRLQSQRVGEVLIATGDRPPGLNARVDHSLDDGPSWTQIAKAGPRAHRASR
jgi:hypothetical protein